MKLRSVFVLAPLSCLCLLLVGCPEVMKLDSARNAVSVITAAVAQPPYTSNARQYLTLLQEQAAKLNTISDADQRTLQELELWHLSCRYAGANGVFTSRHEFNVCYYAFVIETPVKGFFGKVKLPARLSPRGGALHLDGETYWAMAGDIGILTVDVDPIKHTVAFEDAGGYQ